MLVKECFAAGNDNNGIKGSLFGPEEENYKK